MSIIENNHNEWTKEVISILENVRVNSINLSEYHRMRYYYYKGFSKYFDIPVLVLSTLSGTFSVGSQAYLEQNLISAIGCIISMLITIITSIKLYLNIQDTLQTELNMSKDFYTLAIDIYKVLSLPHNLKGEKGLSYLNNKYSLYNKLVEASDLLQKKNKHDQLTIMNIELINDYSNINTNSEDDIQMKNTKKYELPIFINTPKTNLIIDPITTYNATKPKSYINTNPLEQLNNTNPLEQLNNTNQLEQINNTNQLEQINNTNPLERLNNSIQNTDPLQQINNSIQNTDSLKQINNSIQNTDSLQQINNSLQNVNPLKQINNSLQNVNPLQQINNNLQNTDPLERINNILHNTNLSSTISDESLISLFENDSKKKNKKKNNK